MTTYRVDPGKEWNDPKYRVTEKAAYIPTNAEPGAPKDETRALLHCGDAVTVLRTLASKSINCCITSPPYFGLRDYGMAQQIGQEETPEEYVKRLVGVFREVRRVLRDDGTLWLNIGDSYPKKRYRDIKHKDLIGIPWMLAFALRADGWFLRSEIIWHKPTPMPESVKDRPTKAHEQIFLLSKSERYYYDANAVAEPTKNAGKARSMGPKSLGNKDRNDGGRTIVISDMKNCRSVYRPSSMTRSQGTPLG